MSQSACCALFAAHIPETALFAFVLVRLLTFTVLKTTFSPISAISTEATLWDWLWYRRSRGYYCSRCCYRSWCTSHLRLFTRSFEHDELIDSHGAFSKHPCSFLHNFFVRYNRLWGNQSCGFLHNFFVRFNRLWGLRYLPVVALAGTILDIAARWSESALDRGVVCVVTIAFLILACASE